MHVVSMLRPQTRNRDGWLCAMAGCSHSSASPKSSQTSLQSSGARLPYISDQPAPTVPHAQVIGQECDTVGGARQCVGTAVHSDCLHLAALRG